MLSISLLLDSNLISISACVHLRAICVLNEKTAIFVGDCADVVLPDHHLGISHSIGLRGAWDRLKVLIDVVLETTALTLVVGHYPLHRLLAKVGNHTVRVEHFSISIMKLTNDGAISRDQAISLREPIFALTRQLSVVDLADLTRA